MRKLLRQVRTQNLALREPLQLALRDRLFLQKLALLLGLGTRLVGILDRFHNRPEFVAILIVQRSKIRFGLAFVELFDNITHELRLGRPSIRLGHRCTA